MKFFNFPSGQEIQILHHLYYIGLGHDIAIDSVLLVETVAQKSLSVLSASYILRRPHQLALAFLSLGKPLILIILPDFFSDSLQLNSAIFLYLSTPPVSSTCAINF